VRKPLRYLSVSGTVLSVFIVGVAVTLLSASGIVLSVFIVSMGVAVTLYLAWIVKK
jgi:hypothetical protein